MGIAGIYDQPVRNNDQRYDMAFLLLATDEEHQIRVRGDNVRVFVTGVIDADDCNLPDGVVDEESTCVPVRRAIFLDQWEIRRVHD